MQPGIDPRSLIGRKAVGRDGTKIGTIDEVYLDDITGQPAWAAVRTGLFGRDAFVPLDPSEFTGGVLRVPYPRSLIRCAPDFAVGRHLSPEQEIQLYHHYGLEAELPDGDEEGEDGPPAAGRGSPGPVGGSGGGPESGGGTGRATGPGG
nr:PRC-barrel domain-containing protein [Streptomyces zingiberis]